MQLLKFRILRLFDIPTYAEQCLVLQSKVCVLIELRISFTWSYFESNFKVVNMHAHIML